MAINTEKFLEDARKLTEQRMDAAKNIAEAISNRVAAEEALKETEAEERKAYRDAERHGWSKTELNKLKPTKRRRTSQTPKNANSTPTNQTNQTNTTDTSNDGPAVLTNDEIPQ